MVVGELAFEGAIVQRPAQRAAAGQLAAETLAAENLAAEQAAADKLAAEQAAQVEPAQTFAIEATAADALTNDGIEPLSNPAANVAPQEVEQSSTVLPIAASALTRTKYVAPRYPRAAQRRSLTGWVELEFTVDVDGSVLNVSVNNSDPGITFVNSAVTAVEKWEFEPIIENNVAVQKRASVRMMFAVE